MYKIWLRQYPDEPRYGVNLRKTVLVMKLSLAFSLALTVSVHASALGQKVNLQKKNITLKELLNELQTQTKYRFMYKKGILDSAMPINLDMRDAPLSEVLEAAFKNQPFEYRIYDGSVTISPHTNTLVQQATVRGKVIQADNQPMAGVSVSVVGRGVTVATDDQGNYEIKANIGDQLAFKYIGFRPYTTLVNSNRMVTVTMVAAGESKLEEVVVIGYGTQKRSDLTGAMSSIKAEDLPKAASASVEQMIAGKAAGVQVRSTDAQPGGGVEVLIRGAASTGAGNAPLYIIDGFPVTGGVDPGTSTRYQIGNRSPLNSINPNDIESIEVLKDASATAIYGARAANGVILITTKTGKQGRAKVSYDLKTSTQRVQKPWEMMNASQWMRARSNYLHEQWLVNNKIGVYGNTDPSAVPAFVAPYTEDEINAAGNGTNWIDEVTRKGSIQDHNVSISGANEKTNYLMSFNYFGQDGVVKKNDFNRYTGRVNITQEVNSWLKAGVRATGSRIDISNPALGTGGAENTGVLESALKFTPTLPVYLPDGSYSIVANSTFFPNPVSLLDISNVTEQNRLMVQTFAELQPIKDLKIRTQLGFDKQDAINNIYLPKSTLYGEAVGGQANIGQNNRFDKLFNTTVSYRKILNDIHDLSMLVGYEWQSMGSSGHNLSNNKFPTDAFGTSNIGAGESVRPSVGSYKSVNELASYFGRLNYNLLDKYLFTLTMRADGSSRFGKGNKFGYFPSGAFAWKLDKEQFMSAAKWISSAKLRVSAGQTGNSNISGAFAFYSFGSDYLFGNSVNTGTYLSSYANPDLKWETTTEYNLGLDLGLFDERISLTTELFSKTIADLLGERQLKTYLPLDKVAANLGKTSSKGFEVTLNTQNLTGAFQWTSTLTLSAYRDRWKERSPDVVLKSYESATDPIRVHWGYLLDGLVQPGEVVPHMPGALPGVQKVKDINGYDENNQLTGKPDGIINDADVVKLANADPTLIMGFGNTFRYKGFDLNIHVYGMFGTRRNNDYMGYVTEMNPNINRGWNIPNMVDQFWSSENTQGKYPNPFVVNPFPGSGQFLLQKSDFVRVRNITLGYDLNPLFNKKWFNAFRIYVDASNPIVFTSFKGIDPEFTGIYPPAKSFTLGLNVGF